MPPIYPITPLSNVYIYNSRISREEDPNWLGANYDSVGNFTPVLAVKVENLPFHLWNITQDGPGLPFHLEIADKNGSYYRLAAPVEPASGSSCTLQPVSNPQPTSLIDQWCFSYDTRILLAWDLCNPIREQFSLDAGQYPKVIVWDFNSSVNQTWLVSDTPSAA